MVLAQGRFCCGRGFCPFGRAWRCGASEAAPRGSRRSPAPGCPRLLPLHRPTLGPIGRFLNGNAGSQIGVDAAPWRDYWAAINPDLTPLQSAIPQGDRVFARAPDGAIRRGASRSQLATLYQLHDGAIAGLARRFAARPWATQFRLIVSPIVTWIWVGALIMITGALIALAPARRTQPRARATARDPRRPRTPFNPTPSTPEQP